MTDENPWITEARRLGFCVTPKNGGYQVIDSITQALAGELSFNQNSWLLTEPRKPSALMFDGATEAIEYLAAVVSFGNQLA